MPTPEEILSLLLDSKTIPQLPAGTPSQTDLRIFYSMANERVEREQVAQSVGTSNPNGILFIEDSFVRKGFGNTEIGVLQNGDEVYLKSIANAGDPIFILAATYNGGDKTLLSSYTLLNVSETSSSLLPQTVFVNSQSGDDDTAELGNPSMPYETLDQALVDFSGTGENPNTFIRFIITNDDTYELNTELQGLINFEIFSIYSVTISLNNNTNSLLWSILNPVSEFNIYFNIPEGTITRNVSSGAGVQIGFEDLILRLNVRRIENAGTSLFFRGRRVDIEKEISVLSTSSVIFFNLIDGDLTITNMTANSTGVQLVQNCLVSGNIRVRNILGTGSSMFLISSNDTNSAVRLYLGNVRTTGNLEFQYSGARVRNRVYVNFEDSDITAPFIRMSGGNLGETIFSGIIQTPVAFQRFTNNDDGNLRFINFSADITSTTIDITNNSSLFIENCSIRLNGVLANIQGATPNADVVTIINSSIIQNTPTTLITGGSISETIRIYGLTRNALSISDNTDVNIIEVVPGIKRSWTHNVERFNAFGSISGNWNGVSADDFDFRFNIDKATNDLSAITAVSGDGRFVVAPVDCYLSAIQVNVNGNTSIGLLTANGTGNTDISVLYEQATTSQVINETFELLPTTIIIPQGHMIRPYLLGVSGSGGFRGSIAITITEI